MSNSNVFFRDSWVEINLDYIAENIRQLKNHAADKKLYAVLKANAYGHGDLEVAQVALDEGIDMFAVALLDEGLRLRQRFSSPEILIMGAIRPEDGAQAARQNLAVTAQDIEWLRALSDYSGPALNIHLKLDTGMHRLGLMNLDEVTEALDIFAQNENLCLKGLYSHFASADGCADYYQQQVQCFKQLTAAIDLSKLDWVHTHNSAALLSKPELECTNAVRVGIALYGLKPNPDFKLPISLKPALSLYSKVVQIKQLESGDKLGYGLIYTATKKTHIAIIPIGYADGWCRQQQGGTVIINGHSYSIVGAVCMDQLMIEVDDQVQFGDQVELIGSTQTAEQIAQSLNTINYEVVSLISERLPRKYLQSGRAPKITNSRLTRVY